MYVFDKKGHGI